MKLHLELHLGMAGRLYLAPPDHPAAKHDHFVLRARDIALVYTDYRQFGRVFLHDSAPDPWAELPPEVLDRRFTLAHLRRVTTRRAGTAVKALLLDQGVFPGVGNWMADEICWRLPSHPAARVGTLDLALLRKVSRQVCRGAMRHVADKNCPPGRSPGLLPGPLRGAGPPPLLALPTPLEARWNLPSLPIRARAEHGGYPHHRLVRDLPASRLIRGLRFGNNRARFSREIAPFHS